MSFRIFAHAPFNKLDKWIKRDAGYELDGYEVFVGVKHYKEQNTADKIIKCLSGYGITLHAPFMDLGFAPFDDDVFNISLSRIQNSIQLGKEINAEAIILHTGFDYVRIQTKRVEDIWVDKALKMTDGFIAGFKDIPPLLIENVFESDPEMFFRILSKISQNYEFKYCFDTGHCNYLSKADIREWYDLFDKGLYEIHLHDNDGFSDQHLPPLMGNMDFYELFGVLKKKQLNPRIVLEMHDIKEVPVAVSNTRHIIDEVNRSD